MNKWKFPDIPGIEDFEGKMMHTANWQQDVEYKGKKVAVIGNGSSGIQIVPNLQPHVKVLDRGPTWISFGFGEGAARRYNPQGGNGTSLNLESLLYVMSSPDLSSEVYS